MKKLLIILIVALSSCSISGPYSDSIYYEPLPPRPYYNFFFPYYYNRPYYYAPIPHRIIVTPRQQPRPQPNQPRQAPIRRFPPKREP